MTIDRPEFTVADRYAYDRRSPWRWIRSHILRYPWLPALTIISYLLSNGASSLASLLTGFAFDLAVRPGTTVTELSWVSLAILASYVLSGSSTLGGSVALEVVAQRIERDAREELFLSLLGQNQVFHNRQKIGDMMACATNDVQQLNLMVSPGLALILDSLFCFVVPIVSIGFLHLELLLVPLIFVCVFAITLRQYNRALTPIALAQRTQFGRMNARLAETISGIEVVKAYGQEQRERTMFRQHAGQYRDLFVREGHIKARYLPLLFYGMAYAFAFGHAIILFSQGTLTIGQVVAFMGLMSVLDFPTFISFISFSFIQLALAASRRMLALMNPANGPNITNGLGKQAKGFAQPMKGEITFEHVSFGYDDELVLKRISFHAKPGETIALVGQTGSGKTTVTRLVNRIYEAREGRVLIDGVDVRDWDLHALRSQIATIEQDVFLFSRTIAQNIAFGAREAVSQQQIEQAARAAHAHEFIMRLPEGYNTVVGERGVTLSGGQRQRIAIARAFLADPRILILDDSTSAIDSATEDQIQRAMCSIRKGRTTLLITHRISQIRWADRILVLRRGELVAQGTHDEVMQTSDTYRRMFARYL